MLNQHSVPISNPNLLQISNPCTTTLGPWPLAVRSKVKMALALGVASSVQFAVVSMFLKNQTVATGPTEVRPLVWGRAVLDTLSVLIWIETT